MYRHLQHEHNKSRRFGQTLRASNTPTNWGSNQGTPRLASTTAIYHLTENPPARYKETKAIDINKI